MVTLKRVAFLSLLWLLLSLHPGLSIAQNITLDETTTHINISHKIKLIEDPNNTLRLNDILNMKDNHFSEILPGETNKGISTKIYWLKMDVTTNYSEQSKTWVLEHGSPLTDQITLFVPTASKQFLVQTNGDGLAFNQRPFQFTNIAFQFTLPPQGHHTLYARVSSRSSLSLMFNLRSKAAFNDYQAAFYLVNGSYYGMLIIMLIYNLFLFFSIREKAYLVYSLHILFFGAFMTAIDGTGAQYLWPNKTWVNSNGLLFIASASTFFILYFTKVALQTRKFTPVCNFLLKLEIVLLTIIFVATIIVPSPLVLTTYSILMGVIISSVFLISIQVYRAGNVSARFFILAWGIFSLSLVAFSGTVAGVIPNTIATPYYQKIGSFLEVLLLSFALADRIRILTRDKSYLNHKTKLMLRNSNAYLERTNLLKHEFLATISHELRTPMNGVEGALDLIQEKEVPDHLREYVAIAKRSSAQMIKMIDDILLFTEIQSGGIKVRNVKMELHQFIQKLCAPYQLSSEEKGVQFQCHTDDTLPHHIIADPMILEHIIGPILDNAARFTHQGTIQLSVTASPPPEPKGKTEFQFIITDTGPGIDKNRTKEIMQAFTQLDGSHSRKFGGLGVGLSMSRQLAHTIGGQLTVNSIQDTDADTGKETGSRFIVTTQFAVIEATQPLTVANEAEYKESTKPPQLPPEKHLILIVEDNPVNQLVIKKLVKGMGYQIITANDGKQALTQLKTNSIDLVLMDCQMPVMDGYQATEAIRAMPAPMKETPIIAVTANVMTEDQQRCYDVGMDDYLKKPIDKVQLQARIQYWLSPDCDRTIRAS